MTLNWSETAPDCVTAQHFLPILAGHQYRGGQTWHGPDGQKIPARQVTRLIQAAPTPEGPYWDRVRHRQSTEWGSATLRRHVENYLFSWGFRGKYANSNRCTCSFSPCKYTGNGSPYVTD